jgi:hypothetical protein
MDLDDVDDVDDVDAISLFPSERHILQQYQTLAWAK